MTLTVSDILPLGFTVTEQNFIKAAIEFGITDPIELTQLLAQIKQESHFRLVDEQLNYSAEELWAKHKIHFTDPADANSLCCGKDRIALANRLYSNRLGNGAPETNDGFTYRGRGFIQLTGKENYRDVGKNLGIDLVANPDLALDPRYAYKIAIQQYWINRVKSKTINFSDTTAVTKLVNGGTDGLANRIKYYTEYSKKFSGAVAGTDVSVQTNVTYTAQDDTTVSVPIVYDDKGKSEDGQPYSQYLYSVLGYKNGRIPSDKLVPVHGGFLYPDAAESWNRLVSAAAAAGVTIIISDSYRTFQSQIDTVAKRGWAGGPPAKNQAANTRGKGLAGTPGTSNHGWGLAVDVSPGNVNIVGTPQHNWLIAHGIEFGWHVLSTEAWHFQYILPLKKATDVVASTNTTPSTSVPITDSDPYIQKVYLDAYGKDSDKISALKPIIDSIKKNSRLDTELQSTKAILTEDNIQGELSILNALSRIIVIDTNKINKVNNDLKFLSPGGKYALLWARLYDPYPDDMKSKMLNNAYDKSALKNGEYIPANDKSHAWRAPNKLAVTSNLTIAGMSGFKIGQLFLIDRTYSYETEGAFQLFGITEDITIDKGWTTSLYSRFNVLPREYINFNII